MRDTPFALKLCRRLLQVAREVFQDFKFTLRLWANRPWHAGLAITALANLCRVLPVRLSLAKTAEIR